MSVDVLGVAKALVILAMAGATLRFARARMRGERTVATAFRTTTNLAAAFALWHLLDYARSGDPMTSIPLAGNVLLMAGFAWVQRGRIFVYSLDQDELQTLLGGFDGVEDARFGQWGGSAAWVELPPERITERSRWVAYLEQRVLTLGRGEPQSIAGLGAVTGVLGGYGLFELARALGLG